MPHRLSALLLILAACGAALPMRPDPCSQVEPRGSVDSGIVQDDVRVLLTHPRGPVRTGAAWAIARTASLGVRDEGGPAPRAAADKDARDALIIGLGDPFDDVRLAAACGLARHGDARAIVPLEQRRATAGSRLRAAIDSALVRIRARLGRPLLLRGATIVDGTGAGPRAQMSVLVEGAVITRVAPDAELQGSPRARIIDLSGRWVTPGLWDMHVHLGRLGAESLPLFVATGITSVRDMGGPLDELFLWRREIAADRRIGPHIVLAGPMLEAPATVVRIARAPTNEPWQRTRVPVPGAAAAARVVDSVAALGVDFIKIRETIDLDTYRAVAAAARRNDIPLAGHAPFGMAPAEGARLGLTTFEHASYPYPLDTVPAARGLALRAFREGGTAIVPTLVAWSTRLMHPDSLALLIADRTGERDARRRLLPHRLLEEWRYELDDMETHTAESLKGWCGFINRTLADLAVMHDAGIPVLPGTDGGVSGRIPGWSLHEELEMMVRGGVMTDGEALRSATGLAARYAGRGEVAGTVEPGRRADLLILTADPSVDITALRRVAMVVLGGKVLESESLAAMRTGIPLSTTSDIGLLPGVREAGCRALAMEPAG